MKFKTLLLEEDNKLVVIRKSIVDRLPMTIQYTGPEGEVKRGPRFDILPIVLGKHAKSGNLVIWAYVFKGVSKKGLPNWKMFRVDRIVSSNINPKLSNFDLSEIPGYQQGKAPSMMKSLSSVEIFSPYWSQQNEKPIDTTQPTPEVPTPEPTPQQTPSADTEEPQTIVKPEMSNRDFTQEVFNEVLPKIIDVDGKKTITKLDYDFAVNSIYNKKEILKYGKRKT